MLPTHNHLPLEVIERNKAMNWLLDNFPKAFDLRNRKPLKSNILEDVYSLKIAKQPSTDSLEQAFHYYTNWGSYLGAIQEGAAYFNLDGSECSFVTAIEEEAANRALSLAAKKNNCA